MTRDTLDRAFAWVFASGLVADSFTLLWHAGEPLVLPVAFYEEAIALLTAHNQPGVTVHQSFQTNATLLDARWCDFFRRHDVQPGVSVDGPAFLHNRHRRTREGAGTLDRVSRGIALLNEHQISFFVITVLTAESLEFPDELFDFYQSNGISSVGFNMEEIEGPNTTSSLSGPGMQERFRRFLSRFLDLACGADPPIRVREFDTSAGAIVGERFGPGSRTQENKPWAIVNVDCEGNFSTWSPELLGIATSRFGSFSLGNVTRDRLEDVIATERFRALDAEITRGVEMCQQTCPYFAFCGGGPPANKYFENGSFASTETLFCRLHKKACLDVALSRLERQGRAAAGRCVARAPV
jgi:uncharacterized protein